ncbi:DUF2268 domain-containing protein [Sutcliffiella rhizosphaerae]|uniref:DUF2268 domain-containing protein n=1 Tax=Sutcliffiella rhizosphaerae TaxID=2880967 RepID=A0ABN8AI94_9BACI|nr:DUF2268 domain-containing putative Zn-dependent protease [Sutcliffiella rhizosphaerae]CAG9622863.1 hypothetical protein BACCIP111883_03654 [Sutcliffiella rhizosphaerae]
MSIIQTDKWLEKDYHQPLNITKRLLTYFEDVSAAELYDYLIVHGMYRPVKDGKVSVEKLRSLDCWNIVMMEWKRLKKIWNGPDIPIFIFPSDKYNIQIKRDFKGKSGVAFKDKLFLFLPEDIEIDEVKALFIHEYNHICVLAKNSRKDEQYTLLDSVLIEGLAESAVLHQLGENYISNWTNYYSKKNLKNYYEKFILPNKHIKQNEREHYKLLYGKGFYPKMLGYCVGFYLVQELLETHSISYSSLMRKDLNEIAKLIVI